MRLLLDTNILIPLVEEQTENLPAEHRSVLAADHHELFASVASLWEIAIKSRLGKLPLRTGLSQLPVALESAGVALLSIEASHVLQDVEPQPDTRDPFDRLLLAQCLVEGIRLVTLDRALSVHPLAWRPT